VKIDATFGAFWSRAICLAEVLIASYYPVSPSLFAGDPMIPLTVYPAIDATLNGTSSVLLRLGDFFDFPARAVASTS
jgi:hypothetical protein